MKFRHFAFLIFILSSCNLNEQKVAVEPYFDLKSYFEMEAQRLNKLNLQIDKSVSINGNVEHKKVSIKSFEKEFSAFIAADINKGSYKGSFSVKKEAETESYIAENEKIPIKKVEIIYLDNKPKSILIVTETNNILYHSSDTLSYFPDSLYEIKKTQKIRLLKEKKYVIRGEFK